jgi:uncharacterized protein (DUF427 family)
MKVAAQMKEPESVADYPRPPRLERGDRHVRVLFGGEVVADTHRALRILETGHPPTYYIPPGDVRKEFLRSVERRSMCEWKGLARYFDLEVKGRRSAEAAWSYPEPTRDFGTLKGHIAFYAGRTDGCYVDGEKVKPQPGSFYGGWITAEIRGPFKGDGGTLPVSENPETGLQ